MNKNVKLKSCISFSASNYTCHDDYFCSSLYGRSIRGSNDSVAMACSMDSDCKAFRYNPKTKLGFMCKEFDPKHTSTIPLYKEGDWKLCEFDSGKISSDISRDIIGIQIIEVRFIKLYNNFVFI